jgi:hypothetical protein
MMVHIVAYHADIELVALEELAPFRRQQGAVGLNAAGDKLIVAQGKLQLFDV